MLFILKGGSALEATGRMSPAGVCVYVCLCVSGGSNPDQGWRSCRKELEVRLQPFAVAQVKTPPGPRRLGWQNPPGHTQRHKNR